MENRLHEDDGTDRVNWLAGNSGHILEESRIDVARQQGWVSRTSQTSNPKVTDPARLKQGFLLGRKKRLEEAKAISNERARHCSRPPWCYNNKRHYHRPWPSLNNTATLSCVTHVPLGLRTRTDQAREKKPRTQAQAKP